MQGLKAYPSVEALPQPVDLAILIVPAAYVPAELERCGRAGITAAVIFSSGFAEEGDTGTRMQREIAATARRYDMAVSGPNTEGFANIAAALCANFSPASDKSAGPLTPVRALGRGQVSVISQSGGLGFAFLDRARPRNLKFRYIVTTGNEAVLETSDFIDYMLDEGATDVFLLLIEAVKTPEKFKRVAEKALKAGKPLIVGKIGQSEPGRRAVASHTAALAGSRGRLPRCFRTLRIDRRARLRRDARPGCGLPRLRRPPAGRTSRRHLHGVRRRRHMDGRRLRRGGLDVPVLDDATRAALDVHLPSYGTSQNPVNSTAQGVQKLGYAQFARLVARSPSVDGVIVVITARRSGLSRSRSAEAQGPRAQIEQAGVDVDLHTAVRAHRRDTQRGRAIRCSPARMVAPRTMRAMADYRAMREHLLRPVEAAKPHEAGRTKVRAMLADVSFGAVRIPGAAAIVRLRHRLWRMPDSWCSRPTRPSPLRCRSPSL